MRHFILLFGVVVTFGLSLLVMPCALATGGGQAITVTIPAGSYQITDTERGQEITVEDFGYLLVPGKPALPSKIFAIAIPPGAEVVDVSFDAGRGITLPGVYEIAPAPLPRVIGQEDPFIYEKEKQLYQKNFESVYGSDDLYPQEVVEFVRAAGYRKYNLVDVRVVPFTYRPISGKLVCYPEIAVRVSYRPSSRLSEAIVDNLERTERIAEEIIVNYDQAMSWYPQEMPMVSDLHDFVIITLSSLAESVAPLVDWETTKGRNVEVVTTSWIDANYSGYDLAEKMRNFLREKHPSSEWGIEDVLLVGHYDDVPMRRTWQDVGYGKPETDFYYADLSLPDDQSWDIDQDHLYGEDADINDFYAEVSVGRIPWSDPGVVLSICEKSVAYEQNDDPTFKKNILLLGAFFWDDDPNPRTDCAVLMEAKVDQPWMSDWTMTRMYELGYSTYPMDYDLRNSNVVSVWSSGTYAFVNWAGHGSPYSSHRYHDTGEAFIHSSNCPQLNDDYPAIIFADACSNSDTDYLNIGQAMMRQGAVGFWGATKVAYGCPGWTGPLDGSSQSLDYFFTTYVTSGEYSQGGAHQRALRDMYLYGLWYNVKYETFEWGALWGNPDLGMAPPVPRPLVILLPDGLPEYLEPGVPTTFIVRIENGGQNYVAGTGRLHYRYDGGDFLTSELTSIGKGLYEATLPPAGCDAVPEFYISAMGDGGSTVLSPPDAPNSVYTALVGTVTIVMEDNFETHQGWTVSGDALDGHWERGVPVGGGGRGDPPRDFDGSGRCYLTGNEVGDSDVDGGYTYLTSPTIDLCEIEDPQVEYALWYTNNVGNAPNNDLFKTYISSDNGASWVLAETIGPASIGGWAEHSFNVTDFVTPTEQTKVRFEASDLDSASVVEAGIDAFRVVIVECDELPTVSIDIIPDNPPIVVPPGGYFTYTGVVTNNTSTSQRVDLWVMVTLPNGDPYGPVKQFSNVPLGPNQTRTQTEIRQNVSSLAPPGDYVYTAYCGEYPSNVISLDSFEFTVTSGKVSEGVDWTLEGWFDEGRELLPERTELFGNFPNPFNLTTTFSYALANDADVTLEVYDLLGRKVTTLINKQQQAGYHHLIWNAKVISSGVYFYRIHAGDFTEAKKMLLLK